jgi:hypothetical protein
MAMFRYAEGKIDIAMNRALARKITQTCNTSWIWQVSLKTLKSNLKKLIY